MRILIIEDDKDLAQLTKLALEKENFTVDICLDGAEGLYYMQENMYDLVLLDRMLPSMDGTQVLKEARQSNISTPVIFLTALGELQDKVNGLNCGADDYMVKPFAFEELLARIHSIMRRPGKWGDLNLLKLGDIAFDPNAAPYQGCKRMHSFRPRKCPSGSISPKSRSDSSQKPSSLPRMGHGIRRRRRKS